MSRLISVITTTYNAENTVEDTILSVLNQKGVELEYVIVDDGSTDKTLDVMKRYSDPRIHIFEAGRVGRGNALNIGIANSTGKYIAILDADDVSHPYRLKTQLVVMEQHEEIDVLGTDKIRIWDKQVPAWGTIFTGNVDHCELVDVSNRFLYNSPIFHSSAFMRKKMLLKVNCYDKYRKDRIEWDLFIKISAVNGGLFNLSVPLVARRLHKNQCFENKKRIRYIISGLKLQGKAFRTFNKCRIMYLILPCLFMYHLLPLRLRILFRDYYMNHLIK